ncbi:hypothetical protein OROMI_001439 [Orobanche minor]
MKSKPTTLPVGYKNNLYFINMGWEWSAHDMTVWVDSLTQSKYDLPHPPSGKYYLVDSGYPNTTCYLSPIKDENVRYHIPDFKKKRVLKGMSEQFNYRHSSLRTTIERAFGQLKKRWKLLYVMPQMQDKYQILREFPFTRLVCAVSNLPGIISIPQPDVWTWFYSLKQALDRSQFESFVCTCWCLWYNRNRVTHGEKMMEVPEVALSAQDYIRRFKEARLQFHISRPPETVQFWRPLVAPFVKINCDAALLSRLACTGLGMVAHDSAGTLIGWKQKRIDQLYDPEIAEAYAVMASVEYARQRGWTHVMVEGDCLRIIQDVNTSSPCLSSAGRIIEQIKQMSLFFDSIIFSHISRTGNDLAHCLAMSCLVNSEGISVLPF